MIIGSILIVNNARRMLCMHRHRYQCNKKNTRYRVTHRSLCSAWSIFSMPSLERDRPIRANKQTYLERARTQSHKTLANQSKRTHTRTHIGFHPSIHPFSCMQLQFCLGSWLYRFLYFSTLIASFLCVYAPHCTSADATCVCVRALCAIYVLFCTASCTRLVRMNAKWKKERVFSKFSVAIVVAPQRLPHANTFRRAQPVFCVLAWKWWKGIEHTKTTTKTMTMTATANRKPNRIFHLGNQRCFCNRPVSTFIINFERAWTYTVTIKTFGIHSTVAIRCNSKILVYFVQFVSWYGVSRRMIIIIIILNNTFI